MAGHKIPIKIYKSYWLMESGGPRSITVANFINIVYPLWRYRDFSIFIDRTGGNTIAFVRPSVRLRIHPFPLKPTDL